MPTPVNTAKQCLTPESSLALDEAITLAHRRRHSQTTSLHVTSALLTLQSNSLLRDAVSRTQSTSFTSRLQFRALELCFGSALDRLPANGNSSAASADDLPMVSNSLMAAIKRSQANQRRHPDSFHLYQQQQNQNQNQQNQSSFACVRVEIQHLILSILDDPVVSKVFGEAGFRSCDVKMAILRPLPRRCPPLFLSHMRNGGVSGSGENGFSFPFSSFPGFYGSGGNDDCKRIGEIMLQEKKRNPLLVGVSAMEALGRFAEVVERKGNGGVGLPVEVSGLSFVGIEKEVLSGNEGMLRKKLEEAETAKTRVVVSFGDLSLFVDDSNNGEFISYVVKRLTGLLDVNGGKLWLIGGTASYETYLKFLLKFPSIEKDWDLQLLTITSAKGSMGGFQSQPQSLMETFVPFGGFFTTPAELMSPLSRKDQSITRCNLCNEKYEQEVSTILSGGSTPSVADNYQATLPSWLQAAEVTTNEGLDVVKAKDDRGVFNVKVAGLKKKWDDICRRLNHILPVFGNNIYQSVGMPRISSPSSKMFRSLVSEAKNEDFVPELKSSSSKSRVPLHNELTISNIPDSHKATPSALSVTTDLGLGTLYASTCEEVKKPSSEVFTARLKYFSGCSPLPIDAVVPSISNPPVRSSPEYGPDLSESFDQKDFKTLCRTLTEKVGLQIEAINSISRTIASCRARNQRRRGASLKRDIWFNFLGPDKAVKRKIAVALAEIIFGSKQNIISVDLSFHDGISHSLFDSQLLNGNDARFRGKTLVDYITDEIRRKPQSVVFLENIDKADVLVQTSLSQAIKTGKFADSYGTETSINNVIFVTTSRFVDKNRTMSGRGDAKFSEERISGAKNLQMKILTRHTSEDSIISPRSNVRVIFEKDLTIPVNKRKLTNTRESPKRAHKVSRCLDLNLSVDENEENDSESGTSDSDSVSENSELWLEDFLEQVDESITFKPFDFDSLAEDILEDIREVFQNTFGSEGVLEIDSKAMDQILAAAWFSNNKKSAQEWVRQVLVESLKEVRQRYSVKARSIIKLITCEGVYVGEQALGVCLPSRIIFN